MYKERLVDRFILVLSSAFIGLPSFFLALLLLFIASKTYVFPIGGMTSLDVYGMSLFEKIFDILRHAFLPALVLALLIAGPLIRILRNTSLDVLSSPYITNARARGLSAQRILFVHVLRNALNPLITILGYQFSALLSGAAFVEIIFSWPGLGCLMLDAVLSKDIYLIMANLFISAILLLVGNLIADILLRVSDKRISLGIKNV